MTQLSDFRFAPTHEWVKVESETTVVTGISEHAQDALGDLVYVELPEIGRKVEAGEVVGVVESVKTASDIHAPVSGTIIAVNNNLDDDPELINESPYENGWIYKIELTFGLDGLMDFDSYKDQI